MDDQWCDERGPFGYGELNEAGEELLSFVAANGATVCNTWFMKKNILKQTWQHPKSQKWRCIDYVIMKRDQLRKCVDVSVIRGAVWNTDHQLSRAKMMAGIRRACPGPKRNVSSLNGSNVDTKGI